MRDTAAIKQLEGAPLSPWRRRFSGGVVFIVSGTISLTIATVKAWLGVRRQAA